jgi:Cys-rich protein (TIGR01571 family)
MTYQQPGLCSCCEDGDACCFCAKATFLPCAAYGDNYSTAVHGPGHSCTASCYAPCCAHCLLDAALPASVSLCAAPAYLQVPVGAFMLRTQQRINVLLDESYLTACCLELFCGPCSMTQVHLALRGEMVADTTLRFKSSASFLGFVTHPDSPGAPATPLTLQSMQYQ